MAREKTKTPKTSKTKPARTRPKLVKTRIARPASTAAKLDAVLKKENQILANEQAIKREEQHLEAIGQEEMYLEKKTLAETEHEEAGQRDEAQELAKLEKLEREVKEEVLQHPLTKITAKDFVKGIVGAFVGVVVHFTFKYGVDLAAHISMTRASVLYLLSFLIGAGFLYGTGFPKIKDTSLLWLLPYRIVVLYAAAVLVTFVTLAFFYDHFFSDLGLAYRQVAVVNLSAVIGACTADLIGRE
jgi:uncharacterized membrane protein